MGLLFIDPTKGPKAHGLCSPTLRMDHPALGQSPREAFNRGMAISGLRLRDPGYARLVAVIAGQTNVARAIVGARQEETPFDTHS